MGGVSSIQVHFGFLEFINFANPPNKCNKSIILRNNKYSTLLMTTMKQKEEMEFVPNLSNQIIVYSRPDIFCKHRC